MHHTLLSEIDIIKDSLSREYETPYGCLYTPFDEGSFSACQTLAERLKTRNPTLFILVGIGGSNMGALAVVQAMKGSRYYEGPPLRFYCADTIDNDATKSLIREIERELEEGGVPVLCIITKSGSTTETLINGALLYECIKKYRPLDYHEYIIVISDEGSALYSVADAMGCERLPVPPAVGGRYSVFSAVGMFPLMMMGIDGASFARGSRLMLERCLSKDSNENEAAASATTIFNAYLAGCVIHDIFVFSPALAMLGYWYKQLIGESLGKKHDSTGALVEVGISPTVSLGTVDLHSVVQLYLAGPRIRLTTFLSFDHEPTDLEVPDNHISGVLQGLAGRSVTFVKDTIQTGVMQAYATEKRPFMDLTLAYKSSEKLGEFMMMKMVETIFLARLFSINAFDQPAVELYKEQARKSARKSDEKVR
ncbi:hypothetical protein H0W26_05530 [Candidatus Dependentiae bacterium]|nr:hypothetical protein [Candidatus Dependentiae bacterium]